MLGCLRSHPYSNPYCLTRTVRLPVMATIRERRPGVWEVRAFTGRSGSGVPTQVSRTVHGTKKDALRVAAELTVAPSGRAAGRSVSDVLEAWVRRHDATWAPAIAS